MLPRFFAQTRLASECALQAHLCYSWSGVRSSHYLVHPSRRRVGRPHRNSARPPSTCRAVSLVTLPCLDTLVACYIASRCFNHNQRSHNAGVPCPGVCSHSHENAHTHTHIPRLITTHRDQAGNDASLATVQHRIVTTRLSSIVSKLCVSSPGHHFLQMLFSTRSETDFRNEVL